MAKLNVAVRLCCILGVYAGLSSFSTPTTTIVGDSPKEGIGFHIKVDGCVEGFGCTANDTAIFKIQDDAGTEILNTFCTAFDAFNEDSTSNVAASTTSAHFFYAFTMPAGNTGKYWMSKGCFQDANGGVDANDGKVHPSTDPTDWTSFTYTAPAEQYTNQPDAVAAVLSDNRTDVFIPYLLLATPHSPNQALTITSSYRSAQFKYVTKSTPLQLYFSEPVTGVEGKNVYLYEYKPSDDWTGSTEGVTAHTKDASKAFTAAMLNTKASASLSLPENRLYKVLMDAGAFVDANGNAAAGVNGKGTSYSTCVAVNTAPIGRNCLIVFAVPMTFTMGDGSFPDKVDPVDISKSTAITKATNVVLEFDDGVEPGTLSGAMKLTFGPSPLSDADLTIAGTASNCFSDNLCHKLFSSTYYIFEPAEYLQDAVTTYNATEVTVSFTTGAFDYVNAFSYTFVTNRTEYDGHPPELLAYSFADGAGTAVNTYQGNAAYYVGEDEVVNEDDYVSWPGKLVLYFDTRVEGSADKYVALRGVGGGPF